jgi:hypothetical protein
MAKPTELRKSLGQRGVIFPTRDHDPIEINPRPWDQHRLGNTCGVDLIYLAYCEHGGLPLPRFETKQSEDKWIAEGRRIKFHLVADVKGLWLKRSTAAGQAAYGAKLQRGGANG